MCTGRRRSASARPCSLEACDERAAGLALERWEPTKDTLRLWTQIVGKVRLAVAPPQNHWWHVALYVGPFWQAEPEHQDYLERYPTGYTCHFPRPNWVLPRRTTVAAR